jgi:hypothetical protein
MSINCIRCVKNVRTGEDLLCDSCRQARQIPIFYFGCWHVIGHRLVDGSGRTCCGRLPTDFPVNPEAIDSTFLPPLLPQVEGRGHLSHVNGWTLLAFWDRSIDRRGKSNSLFLARGIHTFEEMVNRCRAAFPTVWSRFDFDVVNAAG